MLSHVCGLKYFFHCGGCWLESFSDSHVCVLTGVRLMRNAHHLHRLLVRYGGRSGWRCVIRLPVLGSSITSLDMWKSVLNQCCCVHLGAITRVLLFGIITSKNFVSLFSWDIGGLQ